MTLIKPASLGGIHAPTAALKNVLAAQGVKSPHTGKPFTEAMLLGIGGGLGAGYILWEFKVHSSATIVIGFRNRWNYIVDYLTNLCNRLDFEVTVQETTGKKAALDNLKSALERGIPPIAWADKAHLPHQFLPERLKAMIPNQVGVYGYDEAANMFQIDDIADVLIPIAGDVFAEARGRISSDKSRVMVVTPGGEIDLREAVLSGIADHLEHLGRDSESFSLPVYKKWAKMMTDPKNKKGWPTVFKDRQGLYSTLWGIYEGIRLDDTEGSGLRGIYADFLDEAAAVTDKPALKEAAASYRHLAGLWVELGEAALPGTAFAETRDLLQKRYQAYKTQDTEALHTISQQLEALFAQLNNAFPLDDAGVNALFANLQARLTAIYDAEVAALDTLSAAVA